LRRSLSPPLPLAGRAIAYDANNLPSSRLERRRREMEEPFLSALQQKRSLGYATFRAASLEMTGKTAVPARPSQKFPAIWEPSDADGIRLSGDSSQNLRHPLPVAGRGEERRVTSPE